MTTNWNPDRHESVDAPQWSARRASDAVDEIVDDIEDARVPGTGWPSHPRDDGAPNHGQYTGTAGVAVGLARMYEALDRDRPDWWSDLHHLLTDPSRHRVDHPSLLMGKTGRALAAWRIEPTEANADRVLDAIRANQASNEDELMWGLAGTADAALWMFDRTRRRDFADAARDQARRLWDEWHLVDDGPRMWRQNLFGRHRYYLGAAHGQVGNLHALWRVVDRWPEPFDRTTLLERTVELVETTAVKGPDGTNWPPLFDIAPEPLHWCHGAPGVVAALSVVPAGLDERLDELLVDGARLIWRAGPLTKGPNLCHGTAGNGWAMLKVAQRTGDETWLRRARHFAMAAVEQRRRICQEFDRGWYSLWTGDVGLGAYLCSCLDESTDWIGWERF